MARGRGKQRQGGRGWSGWSCPRIGLACVTVWEFGALKTLTRTLGRIAVVECFSTSSCYLLEGTLTPAHMENLFTSAELQVFTKAQHGLGLSGEQCALRATVSFGR